MGRTAAAYRQALQSLLPKGPAWSKEADSVLSELLLGMAEEFSRIDFRAADLKRERDTRYAVEILGNHEDDLGIPDECIDRYDSITVRQWYANAKLTAHGRLNKEMFYEMAEEFGWEREVDIKITEFKPFWVGLGVMGDDIGDNINLYYWMVEVSITAGSIVYFRTGQSSMGDPLQYIPGHEYLLCLFGKYNPAHRQIIWRYFGPDFSWAFSSAFDRVPSYLGGATTAIGPFDNSFHRAFDKWYGNQVATNISVEDDAVGLSPGGYFFVRGVGATSDTEQYTGTQAGLLSATAALAECYQTYNGTSHYISGGKTIDFHVRLKCSAASDTVQINLWDNANGSYIYGPTDTSYAYYSTWTIVRNHSRIPSNCSNVWAIIMTPNIGDRVYWDDWNVYVS